MSECLHDNASITFTEIGEKWNVCKKCGTFLKDSELALYKQLSTLQTVAIKARMYVDNIGNCDSYELNEALTAAGYPEVTR